MWHPKLKSLIFQCYIGVKHSRFAVWEKRESMFHPKLNCLLWSLRLQIFLLTPVSLRLLKCLTVELPFLGLFEGDTASLFNNLYIQCKVGNCIWHRKFTCEINATLALNMFKYDVYIYLWLALSTRRHTHT